MSLRVRFYDSIEDIGQSLWRRLSGTDYPFIRYEFLHALETAGGDTDEGAACTKQSGWQPHHAVIYDGEQALAALPLYLKYHSYGEYIFDWAWADAYHRHGISYYPKLLAAIPYSPVTGPRITIASDANVSRDTVYAALSAACQQECQRQNASSFHLLFPAADVSRELSQHQLLQRHSYQFHWFNKNASGAPFECFDDFLGELKSRKRKAIKKERKLIDQQGIDIIRLDGDRIDDAVWDTFYHFYQLTYAKRSGHGGYLPKAFFKRIADTMADQIMLVLAIEKETIVAGALNFFSGDTLFGRYWGCSKEAEFLHFEVCYYQGIEFCIERGLHKFDAGAQGEHKIQRGFRPMPTWSNHWIAHDEFREAIGEYLDAEAINIRQHIEETSSWLPFKDAGLAEDN